MAVNWLIGSGLGENEMSKIVARLGCLSLVREDLDAAGMYSRAIWPPWSDLSKEGPERVFVSMATDLERGDLAGAESKLAFLGHWLVNINADEEALVNWDRFLEEALAAAFLRRGEPGQALTTIARSDGPPPTGVVDPLLEGWLMASTAEALLANGQPPRAEGELRAARDAWAERGYQWNVGLVRASVVWIELLIAEDRTTEATAALEHLRGVVERQHSIDPCPRTTGQLAALALLEGDLLGRRGDGRAAEARWREAVRLLEPGQDGAPGADHRLTLGAVYLRLGLEDEARLAVQPLVDLGWRWPGWVARLAGEAGREGE
jgi:hypothetical protein